MNQELDFKYLLSKGLKYWYVFLLFMGMALAAAYFYLQFKVPGYQASALLQIKNIGEGSTLDTEALFTDLGLGEREQNLENEIYKLRSTPMMEEVVTNLSLQHQYYSVGPYGLRNIYKKSPLRVLEWKPVGEYTILAAEIVSSGRNGYTLITDEKEYQGEFGNSLKTEKGTLILSRQGEFDENQRMAIRLLPIRLMTRQMLRRLSITVLGDQSSTMRLQLNDSSPERAQDVLMALMNLYIARTVEDKNKVYENSIDLIKERIQLVADELSKSERNVEAYKRSNNLMALGSEGSLLLSEMATAKNELSNIDVQLEILNSIQNFLEENRNSFEFVPTNSSLNNLTLQEQIFSFNQLLRDAEAKRTELGAEHPELILIEKQITNLRTSIINNITSIKSDLEIARKAQATNREDIQQRMQSLPRQERVLVEMERNKSVTENLYLYLLQKREENAISMSATTADGEVIQPAEMPLVPVSPNPAQIYLIAFFLGLALPIGLVILLETLNDKIVSEEEIERITNVPIIGSVMLSKGSDALIIKENSHTVQAEMFRLLRANLNYVMAGRELQVLLMTSSMSGEGKSYIALNLGMIQALTGKRVLIIDLDLRRPRQQEYLKTEKDRLGVVNYLVDHSLTLPDIIFNSGTNENLDIITSGPKPPNPSELILSPRLRLMMDELREQYDFIILDAPPVGLVADALQMEDLTEATLYVVRSGLTRRRQIHIVEDIARKEKLPVPLIVLNAVRPNQTRYGSNYGYGYGGKKSGYYTKA